MTPRSSVMVLDCGCISYVEEGHRFYIDPLNPIYDEWLSKILDDQDNQDDDAALEDR